jgi:hypothetical protein
MRVNAIGPSITITATKDDGVPALTKKRGGDTVTYTNTISNTAGPDAANVQFIDPDVAHSNYVDGSLKATPVAVDDSYALLVIANTAVDTSVSSGFNVLANDFYGYAGGVALTAANAAVTVSVTTPPTHGSVSFNSGANKGTFVYTPTPGYTGLDSFKYTLANGVSGALNASDQGTVTLTVGGPVIWYVDAVNGSNSNNGTLGHPFQTLGKVSTVDAANQKIFLIGTNVANYTGGITLKAGEFLIGQAAQGGSFDTVLGIVSPSADTPARPILTPGSTRPQVTNAGGNAITLAEGNTLVGLDVTSASGSGISGTGINVGIIGNASTSDVSISGSTANGIVLSGGSGNFAINAPISTSAGHSVSISNRTGGTVAFGQAVGDTGTGIILTSNTGATINFTAAVTASTGANTAFNANGGGTVTVTATASTLTTTTGTALNVVNTTIGVGGLAFKSINAGTAASGPANGIVLTSTGASGSLTVSGNGNAAVGGDNSGGTIQKTTGVGIALSSTLSPSFTNMNIINTTRSGIAGTSVTNFSLTNSKINTTGTQNADANIAFNSTSFSGPQTLNGNNISGVLTITGNIMSNGFSAGLDIQSDNGTVTNATVSNNAVSNSGSGTAALSFVGIGNGSTVFNLNNAVIANNTITGQKAGGIQVSISNSSPAGGAVAHAGFVTFDGLGRPVSDASHIISITGNSITAIDTNATQAIVVANSCSNNSFRTQTNFEIKNNGTVGTPLGSSGIGTAVLIGNNGNSDMCGVVDNNVIVANQTPNLGGGNGIAGGNGSTNGNTDTPKLNLVITNNRVSNTDGNGMLFVGRGVSGVLYLKIAGNTIGAPVNSGGTVRQGIRVDAGNASSADDAVFLNIFSNTSGGSNGASGIGLRKQGAVATTNDFGLYDASGGPTLPSPPNNSDITNFVTSLNPGSVNGLAFGTGGADIISGSNYLRDVTLAPPLIFAAGGIEKALPATTSTMLARTAAPALQAAPVIATVPVPMAASALRPQPNHVTASSWPLLKQSDLDAVVLAAIARWQASGLTSEQLAHLHTMGFEVVSLDDNHLGEAGADTIRVDATAGGNGWFTDASAASDALFSTQTSATRRYTLPTAAPAGQLDLLTTILHEMGHSLGLNDTYSLMDRNNIMYGHLTKGERRLPAQGQAHGATPFASNVTHFLTNTVANPAINPLTIGTLPAGKSVVITYSVQVENPITGSATQLDSQATVHSTSASFSDVASVDYESGAATGSAHTFTLLAPPPTVAASVVSLAQNAPGMIIAGTFFNTTPANNTVVFNDGAVGTVTAATSTQLTISFSTPPTAIGALTAIVTTPDGNSGSAVQVATIVASPMITSSTASVGINATTVKINGSNFSATPGNNTVVFNDGAVGTVTAATATQLTVTLSTQPTNVGNLTANVTVFGGSTGAIQVATVVPVVTVNTATLAANANSISINGFGFNANPLNDGVTFSGAGTGSGTVSAASPTGLGSSLPTSMVAGVLNASVSSGGVSSGTAVQVATIKPVVTSSSASLAANASSMTINGFGFDTTLGNNSVVLSDGAVGTVTAATNTALTVTFSTTPASAGSLTAVVTTNSVSSGGAVQVAMVIPVVTMSTATVQNTATTLTINGFGFASSNASNSVVLSSGTGSVTSSSPTQIVVTFGTAPSVGNLTATVTSNTLSSGAAVQVASVVSITITPGSPLSGGTAGTLYTKNFTTTGASLPLNSFSVTSIVAGGTGLTGGNFAPNLATGTLALSFTPTAAGTATFTLNVTDSTNATVAVNYSLTVNPVLSISPAALAAATSGTVTNQTMTVTGGTTPYTTFNVTAFSAGTTGLTAANLTATAATGIVALSGTPTAAGTATFTVNTIDTAGATLTKNYTLTVNPALSFSPASLAAATATKSTSQTITVAGGTTPYTALTVTSFVAGGTGLTAANLTANLGAGTVALSGTPTAAGTVTFTVNVTDTAGATASKNYSLTVNPALTIAPAALAAATATAVTTQTITVSNGTTPYTALTVTAFTSGPTGLTPSNLTANVAAGTVVLSGTPTAAGTCTFTVNATDTAGATLTKNYTLTVNAALSFLPASLAGATANTATTQTITVGNGTTPYTALTVTSFVAGGTGLTAANLIANVGTGTVALSGTPTAAGTATFTVNATDTAGATASKNYSLTVNPTLTIAPAALVAATATAVTTQTITVSNGTTPYTTLNVTAFSAGTTGLTAANLTANAGAGTVVLSGTPTAAGTATFTVNVTDTAGATATKNYTLTVNTALSISPAALAGATSGTATSQTITVAGGTTPYTALTVTSFVAGGTGLTAANLTATAATGTVALSGTATAAGTVTFTVNVTDTAGATASKNYTLTVNPALSVAPGSLVAATAGKSTSQTITVSNGTTPYTALSVTSFVAGGTGLTAANLTANVGAGTVVLSGTPTAAGTVTFTVNATDTAGATTSKNYSLTVNPAMTIAPASLAGATVNTATSQTITVSNGTTPYTALNVTAFAGGATGLTAANLTANVGAGTVALSGTPTAAGTATFTVNATDTAGATLTKNYTLTVNAALSIAPASLSSATAGSATTQTITVTNGTTPYTTLNVTAFAPGTTGLTAANLTTNSGAGTVVLSGTPPASGTATFTVNVTDTAGATLSKNYTLIVGETVALTAADTTAAVTGGDTGTYRFSRGGNGAAVTVNFTLNGASTVITSEYSLSGGSVTFNGSTGTAIIPAGSTSVDVTLTALANASGIAKGAKTVQLDLASSVNYTTGAPATGTVTIAQNGFVVFNTNDSGQGSLRQALANADGLAGNDSILFDAAAFGSGQTITLISVLGINSNVLLTGPAVGLTVRAASAANNVFSVNSGAVTFRSLTIRDGSNGISKTSAADMTAINCTFAGNVSGIVDGFGTATVINSTFSGNGTGVALPAFGSVNVYNCTISGNTTGVLGGVGVALYNTLCVGNTTNTNGAFTDGGGNRTTGTAAAAGLDATGLQNNGGPTPTIALVDGSVAVNAGSNALLPADTFDINGNLNTVEALPLDQRGTGFPRVQGTTVDIGAFEALLYTPSLTAATTNEDTQSTSGLVITRNTADAGGTTNYQITAITNGTLYQSDGTTAIANNVFITTAQGAAGLKFTPAANLFSPTTTPFGFSVQASTTADVSGLKGSVVPATIKVNPVADTPSITNSATTVNTQSAFGLVITRNVVDGSEVAFFKISNIQHGAVYQNDGATPINAGDFITFAQGNAGLKFTPSLNFIGVASFDVQGSVDNAGTGISAGIATASIPVGTVNPTPTQQGPVDPVTGLPLPPGSPYPTISQTGLIQVQVGIKNTTAFPINGFRLSVDYSAYLAASPSLRLYNSSSAPGVSPAYIDYPFPVAVGATVTLKLEYYSSTRTLPSPFTPILTVTKLAASEVSSTDGSGVQPRIVVRGDGTVLLEWDSTPGLWYRIKYSADLTNWYDTTVPVQAVANRTQWIDDGPPFTSVSPATVPARFYRLNQIAAPTP